MFQIPQNLDPKLMGLAWLLGHWEGTGRGTWPDRGEFEYGQRVDFSQNGGGYLHYISQLYEIDSEGQPLKPLSMETGFWRPQQDGTVEVVMCHPDGYAEVWVGKITGARIELTTDAVARTVTSELQYTGGHRLYGNVEGDLMWTFDRATTTEPLQPHLWARLQRVES